MTLLHLSGATYLLIFSAVIAIAAFVAMCAFGPLEDDL